MIYLKPARILLILFALALSTGFASAATEDNEFSLKLPACKKDSTAWTHYLKSLPKFSNPIYNLIWADLDGDGQCDVLASMAPEFQKGDVEGQLTFPWIMKNAGCTFLFKNKEFDSFVPGTGTLNCKEAEYPLASAMPIYSKIAKKTFFVGFQYQTSDPGLLIFGGNEAEKKFPHTHASVMRFYLRSLLRLQRDFIATYRKKSVSGHEETQGQFAASMLHDEIDGVEGWKAADLFALPEEQADKLVEQIRAEVAAEPIGTGTGIHP